MCGQGVDILRKICVPGPCMSKTSGKNSQENRSLPKAPTGIQGLDEITGGGFPRGRPTLVCGSAGAGKTLLAMEFLIRGATKYNEPGVFMAFEETAPELTQNVRSLGFDLDELAEQKKLIIDYVRIERSEIDETGDYDLEGLFIRLAAAIDAVGARRVVLDTIENLFAGLQNEGILRAELRRLFRWLKDKGVTAVITAERGEGALTRHGLEEYVSDCVILLDHRVTDQVSTRRLRIVKYRGTAHGTTILGSGTAGTGKTSLAAHVVDAACRRGERCLYFSFEESQGQLIRNMRSIGLNLEQWSKKNLLQFHSSRATFYGLEMHLAIIHKIVQEFQPRVVIIDPIGSLIQAGNRRDAHTMLIRLIDFLKQRQVTAFLTNLTSGGEALEKTDVEISSIVDTWLFMRDIELDGERNRALYVLKSRGMAHSNQLREFLLTEHGVDLLNVYVGPEGVLTGSSRLSQEAREEAAAVERRQVAERKERERTRKREALEARIAALRKEFEVEEEEAATSVSQDVSREKVIAENRAAMSRSRQADMVKGSALPKGRRSS